MGLESIDIGFDKTGTLESGLNLEEYLEPAAQQISQKRLESDKLISDAIATYDLDFF